MRVHAVLEGLRGIHDSIIDVAASTITVRYDATRIDAFEIAREIDATPMYSCSGPEQVAAVSMSMGSEWRAVLDRPGIRVGESGALVLSASGAAGTPSIELEADEGLSFGSVPLAWNPRKEPTGELPFTVSSKGSPVRWARVRIRTTEGGELELCVPITVAGEEPYGAR